MVGHFLLKIAWVVEMIIVERVFAMKLEVHGIGPSQGEFFFDPFRFPLSPWTDCMLSIFCPPKKSS